MNDAEDANGKGVILLLHPDDNVLIACRQIQSGEMHRIDGQEIVIPQTVQLGHKIARRRLFGGDRVRRYGFAIGTMTQPAAAGEHIHRHNLRSDYISSHGRETVGTKEQQA